MKAFKKILAIVLSAMMLLSLLPFSALADSPSGTSAATSETIKPGEKGTGADGTVTVTVDLEKLSELMKSMSASGEFPGLPEGMVEYDQEILTPDEMLQFINIDDFLDAVLGDNYEYLRPMIRNLSNGDMHHLLDLIGGTEGLNELIGSVDSDVLADFVADIADIVSVIKTDKVLELELTINYRKVVQKGYIDEDDLRYRFSQLSTAEKKALFGNDYESFISDITAALTADSNDKKLSNGKGGYLTISDLLDPTRISEEQLVSIVNGILNEKPTLLAQAAQGLLAANPPITIPSSAYTIKISALSENEALRNKLIEKLPASGGGGILTPAGIGAVAKRLSEKGIDISSHISESNLKALLNHHPEVVEELMPQFSGSANLTTDGKTALGTLRISQGRNPLDTELNDDDLDLICSNPAYYELSVKIGETELLKAEGKAALVRTLFSNAGSLSADVFKNNLNSTNFNLSPILSATVDIVLKNNINLADYLNSDFLSVAASSLGEDDIQDIFEDAANYNAANLESAVLDAIDELEEVTLLDVVNITNITALLAADGVMDFFQANVTDYLSTSEILEIMEDNGGVEEYLRADVYSYESLIDLAFRYVSEKELINKLADGDIRNLLVADDKNAALRSLLSDKDIISLSDIFDQIKDSGHSLDYYMDIEATMELPDLDYVGLFTLFDLLDLLDRLKDHFSEVFDAFTNRQRKNAVIFLTTALLEQVQTVTLEGYTIAANDGRVLVLDVETFIAAVWETIPDWSELAAPDFDGTLLSFNSTIDYNNIDGSHVHKDINIVVRTNSGISVIRRIASLLNRYVSITLDSSHHFRIYINTPALFADVYRNLLECGGSDSEAINNLRQKFLAMEGMTGVDLVNAFADIPFSEIVAALNDVDVNELYARMVNQGYVQRALEKLEEISGIHYNLSELDTLDELLDFIRDGELPAIETIVEKISEKLNVDLMAKLETVAATADENEYVQKLLDKAASLPAVGKYVEGISAVEVLEDYKGMDPVRAVATFISDRSGRDLLSKIYNDQTAEELYNSAINFANTRFSGYYAEFQSLIVNLCDPNYKPTNYYLQLLQSLIPSKVLSAFREHSLLEIYYGESQFSAKVENIGISLDSITSILLQIAHHVAEFDEDLEVILRAFLPSGTLEFDVSLQFTFTDVYKVTYCDENGETLLTTFLPRGINPLVISIPEMEHRTALYWKNGQNNPVNAISGDQTLYPEYEDYCIVSYVNSDGTSLGTERVVIGNAPANLPEIPIPDNVHDWDLRYFLGSQESENRIANISTYLPTEDVTIVVAYVDVTTSHLVTYYFEDENGNRIEIGTENVLVGEQPVANVDIPNPPETEKGHYVVSYYDADGNEISLDSISVGYHCNITIRYELYYTIEYRLNGVVVRTLAVKANSLLPEEDRVIPETEQPDPDKHYDRILTDSKSGVVSLAELLERLGEAISDDLSVDITYDQYYEVWIIYRGVPTMVKVRAADGKLLSDQLPDTDPDEVPPAGHLNRNFYLGTDFYTESSVLADLSITGDITLIIQYDLYYYITIYYNEVPTQIEVKADECLSGYTVPVNPGNTANGGHRNLNCYNNDDYNKNGRTTFDMLETTPITGDFVYYLRFDVYYWVTVEYWSGTAYVSKDVEIEDGETLASVQDQLPESAAIAAPDEGHYNLIYYNTTGEESEKLGKVLDTSVAVGGNIRYKFQYDLYYFVDIVYWNGEDYVTATVEVEDGETLESVQDQLPEQAAIAAPDEGHYNLIYYNTTGEESQALGRTFDITKPIRGDYQYKYQYDLYYDVVYQYYDEDNNLQTVVGEVPASGKIDENSTSAEDPNAVLTVPTIPEAPELEYSADEEKYVKYYEVNGVLTPNAPSGSASEYGDVNILIHYRRFFNIKVEYLVDGSPVTEELWVMKDQAPAESDLPTPPEPEKPTEGEYELHYYLADTDTEVSRDDILASVDAPVQYRMVYEHWYNVIVRYVDEDGNVVNSVQPHVKENGTITSTVAPDAEFPTAPEGGVYHSYYYNKKTGEEISYQDIQSLAVTGDFVYEIRIKLFYHVTIYAFDGTSYTDTTNEVEKNTQIPSSNIPDKPAKLVNDGQDYTAVYFTGNRISRSNRVDADMVLSGNVTSATTYTVAYFPKFICDNIDKTAGAPLVYLTTDEADNWTATVIDATDFDLTFDALDPNFDSATSITVQSDTTTMTISSELLTTIKSQTSFNNLRLSSKKSANEKLFTISSSIYQALSVEAYDLELLLNVDDTDPTSGTRLTSFDSNLSITIKLPKDRLTVLETTGTQRTTAYIVEGDTITNDNLYITTSVVNNTVTFRPPHFTEVIFVNEYLLTSEFVGTVSTGTFLINGVEVPDEGVWIPEGATIAKPSAKIASVNDRISSIAIGNVEVARGEDFSPMPSHNVTATVTTIAAMFEVRYRMPDGTLYTDKTDAEAWLEANPNATPIGYTFTKNEIGYVFTNSSTDPAVAKVDVYCTPALTPVVYTIVFRPGHGASDISYSFTILNAQSGDFIAPALPAIAGYTAVGWSAYDLSAIIADPASNIVDGIYVAQFYTVTYPNGSVAALHAGDNVNVLSGYALPFGYEIESISYLADDGTVTVLPQNNFVFTMPCGNVNVIVSVRPVTLTITVNGNPVEVLFDSIYTFDITLSSDEILAKEPNARLIAFRTNANGSRILTYAADVIPSLNLSYRVEKHQVEKITNGLIGGETDQNATYQATADTSFPSAAYSFAVYESQGRAHDLLWLWILLIVLLIVAVFTMLYLIIVRNELGSNLFTRPIVAIGNLFLTACLGVYGLFARKNK